MTDSTRYTQLTGWTTLQVALAKLGDDYLNFTPKELEELKVYCEPYRFRELEERMRVRGGS